MEKVVDACVPLVNEQNEMPTQCYLLKRGAMNKSWKTRWFTLDGDKLFYFKVAGDTKPVGWIELADALIRVRALRAERCALCCASHLSQSLQASTLANATHSRL
jgi:hypothetical protein